jgi:thiamine pyrophosphate-dependent acetolactate synthase large subunit-like protein
VVVLIGDGAFLYNPTIPSFGFAKDANLPILIVIYNNQGYRSMRDSQLAYYPDGAGARSRQFYGETINGFNYEDLIKPFDGFGIRVETQGELQSALQRGHAVAMEGRTAIVNVALTE